MRKMSLVAACCSAASRISRPCAAIVFFSFETESAEDAARGFGLVFFAAFLVVLAIRAKDSVVFAVEDDSPQRPSAAEPQPKLGVSPAKTQRAQSSEIEGKNHS